VPITSVTSRQQCGHGCRDEHGGHEAGDHFKDETAALENIAERHEKEQSNGIAGLRGYGNMAHLASVTCRLRAISMSSG
jgi:hypothetical protein